MIRRNLLRSAAALVALPFLPRSSSAQSATTDYTANLPDVIVRDLGTSGRISVTVPSGMKVVVFTEDGCEEVEGYAIVDYEAPKIGTEISLRAVNSLTH